MTRPRSITVLTHQQPDETREAVRRLVELAADRDVELRFPSEEIEKHGIEAGAGRALGADPEGQSDLIVVFGGDGTILTALRAGARNRTPVFGLNFGAIGFLSTIDREHVEEGLTKALEGDFELIRMPALAIEFDGERRIGINDISFQRKPNCRVAILGYSVGSEQLGRVRCDGLVAATPVGSTGYNLANGGPVLAWGVEGFVVSFIAPHTLTARALVVAPGDPLTVANESEVDSVDVTTDGRPVGALAPGEELSVRFQDDQVLLAQLPGASFYHRFRDKFGRLAH
ncbi:MAG: NAD(+)/NADH kinase [Actinobacteria bacterium]|nr:NAD(+)/NADH kinase [Actinomycetota bacterium]